MKIKTFLAVNLIVCVAFISTNAFAAEGGMTLGQLFKKLTRSNETSLQKMDKLEEYKGLSIRGTGKVKDIMKSPGEADKALVYLIKSYRYKTYELVLTVDAESVKKIKKGNYLRFVGNFEGMALETLRFDDATILSKPFLCFS